MEFLACAFETTRRAPFYCLQLFLLSLVLNDSFSPSFFLAAAAAAAAVHIVAYMFILFIIDAIVVKVFAAAICYVGHRCVHCHECLFIICYNRKSVSFIKLDTSKEI